MIKAGIGVPIVFALAQLAFGLVGDGQNFTVSPARICEVGNGISVAGFVVRQEVALPPMDLPTVLCCREGEWIGKGQTIALGFDRQADARQEETRRQLLAERTVLLNALRDKTSPAERLAAMARGAASPSEVCAAIMLADSGDRVLRQRAQNLWEQADALSCTPAAELTAPVAGYFYNSTDGWEQQLNRAALDTLPKLQTPERQPSVGKLITANEWYYAANLPTEQVKNCCPGERVMVRLWARVPELEMRILSIRDQRGGTSVLILKSDRFLREIAELRQVPAELTFHTKGGLRIEKQALYLDEAGETGVYVLQGAQAVWKQVSLIADGGEFYLVQRETADNGLQPGDPVICAEETLYDGKVINP